jgi:hypothetical protein
VKLLVEAQTRRFGVPDGFRTRDLLSHSQAFYP